MGSGSGGDGVRLVDCEGEVVDVVVYGEDNADDIEDESGEASSSLAGKPGDDVVLARYVDGGDSDRSGDDFWLTEDWTPGASNLEPPRCDPAGSEGVKLNELVSNPEGSDDGHEWVEPRQHG